MIIYAFILIAIAVLCIYLTSKDGRNGVACPKCSSEMIHFERVIRPFEDAQVVKVIDKFKCPRCGECYARHALHEHRHYYHGIWHGGKEGWGVRPDFPTKGTRFFSNPDKLGYSTHIDETISDLYPIDLKIKEDPIIQEHPIEETSSIRKKHVIPILLLFIVIVFILLSFIS